MRLPLFPWEDRRRALPGSARVVQPPASHGGPQMALRPGFPLAAPWDWPLSGEAAFVPCGWVPLMGHSALALRPS